MRKIILAVITVILVMLPTMALADQTTKGGIACRTEESFNEAIELLGDKGAAEQARFNSLFEDSPLMCIFTKPGIKVHVVQMWFWKGMVEIKIYINGMSLTLFTTLENLANDHKN